MYGFGELPGNSPANSYAGISSFYTGGRFGAALTRAQLGNRTDSSKILFWGDGAKYTRAADITSLHATWQLPETTVFNFN